MSRIGLPQTLVRLVTYASLAALVVLAALILANEVRASGVLRRRPRVDLETAAGPRDAVRRPLSLQDIERAAPVARPGLLLELILERLGRLRALESARSRTVRELNALVSAAREDDGRLLFELASTAERVRYGGVAASALDLTGALAAGRTLLERIEATGDPAGRSESKA